MASEAYCGGLLYDLENDLKILCGIRPHLPPHPLNYWPLATTVRNITYAIPKPLRLRYVNLRTQTGIEIWALLTETLRYLGLCIMSCACEHHVLPVWSVHICWLVDGKSSLVDFVAAFCEFVEIYECRTKCNWSLGMEYNGKLYGFSAVKVKLVDSLIWRPFILGRIRPREPMTGPIWHLCEFLFWTIRSLNFRTFIDALCNNCY